MKRKSEVFYGLAGVQIPCNILLRLQPACRLGKIGTEFNEDILLQSEDKGCLPEQ